NVRSIDMRPAKGTRFALIFASLLLPFASCYAEMKQNNGSGTIQPSIIRQISDKAKKNTNWKTALLTGKHGQVVLMNVSPETSPKNEIGMETHKFDQIIYIAEGKAKAVLNGKESTVTVGDMIFIPQGTQHNFINLSTNQPLKIISIYS